MKGLREYSHKERSKVIAELIPLIKKKFGSNLIALAAQGAYGKGTDRKFSDLELIAFVKKMPKGKESEGMGKIRDGLLVELQWTTEETYLKNVKGITRDWFMSGADHLLPLINKKFIERVNKYKSGVSDDAYQAFAMGRFYIALEDSAKVLNAIDKKDAEAVGLFCLTLIFGCLDAFRFSIKPPIQQWQTTLKRQKS